MLGLFFIAPREPASLLIYQLTLKKSLNHLQVGLGARQVLRIGLALLYLRDQPFDLPDDLLPIFSDRISDKRFGQIVELWQTALEAEVKASLTLKGLQVLSPA